MPLPHPSSVLLRARTGAAAAAVRAALAAMAAVTVAATLAAAPAVAMPGPAPDRADDVVHLVTGETVLLGQHGNHAAVQVVTRDRSGPGAAWSGLRLGADLYVVPAVARPYLGGALDPLLFDVTAQRGQGGTVPVDVTFPSGHPAGVPGLTVTASTPTSQHGYLTSAGSRRFGEALQAQWQHDARPGVPATRTLFGADRITRTGATPVVTPDYPQVTLVVRELDAQGAPVAAGLVGLINTDDGRRYLGFVSVRNGQARVSVPLGHYSAIGDSSVFDPATGSIATSIATVPDFTVSRNLQTLTVDTSTATVTPTVRTPKPAGLVELDLTWTRSAGHGGLSFSYGFGPNATVTVAPAGAPRYGQLDWSTAWSLAGAPVRGLPYTYDLAFDDGGSIPVDQARTVATSQLAEVDANHYTDGPDRTALFGRSPVFPGQAFIFTTLWPLAVPVSRTEYLLAPPGVAWSDVYVAPASPYDSFGALVHDGLRTYLPGTRQRIDWLRGPLAPGIPATTDSSPDVACPSCRTDHRMAISLAPVLDTTPGHVGDVEAVPGVTTVHFRLLRNGTVIADLPGASGGVFPVPTAPATYTVTEETDRQAAGSVGSSHALTTLTFRSAAGTGAPLPSGWSCVAGGSGSCTVLPVLTATVPLPTDLRGALPVGSTDVVFTIAPAPGAAAAPVSDAHLGIAVDGAPFRSVPVVALGGDRFRATIVHTAVDAGRPVDLQVSGSDAAGDTITETVAHAYTVDAG